MQARAHKYLTAFWQWAKPFIEEPLPQTTTHCCALQIKTKEILLTSLNKIGNTTQIDFCETIPYDDVDNLPFVLSHVVKQYHLSTVPVNWLLTSQDYQLFLIESLPVKAEELKEAVNWRVRSLITYPMNEAVIDYFRLPLKKELATESPLVVAVVSKKNYLQTILPLFQTSELHVAAIDIPELALRNLSALYENDEKSIAFLYFYDNMAVLNITRQKILYFTRDINLAIEKEQSDKQLFDYEKISLDILRYFDYYQSQWRHPSPSHMYIAAENSDVEIIAKSLSSYLDVFIQPYSLPSVFSSQKDINTIEKKYLLTIGGALREMPNHV